MAGGHESTGEVDLHLKRDASIAIVHPKIDEQHQRLFFHANEFIDITKTCGGSSQVSATIDALGRGVRAFRQISAHGDALRERSDESWLR